MGELGLHRKGGMMSASTVDCAEPDPNGVRDTEPLQWELVCSEREACCGFFVLAEAIELTHRAREGTRSRGPRATGEPVAPRGRHGGLDQCPECAGRRLTPVQAGTEHNVFCPDCVLCWHVEADDVSVVDPWTCVGCQLGTTACFERWRRDGYWDRPPLIHVGHAGPRGVEAP